MAGRGKPSLRGGCSGWATAGPTPPKLHSTSVAPCTHLHQHRTSPTGMPIHSSRLPRGCSLSRMGVVHAIRAIPVGRAGRPRTVQGKPALYVVTAAPPPFDTTGAQNPRYGCGGGRICVPAIRYSWRSTGECMLSLGCVGSFGLPCVSVNGWLVCTDLSVDNRYGAAHICALSAFGLASGMLVPLTHICPFKAERSPLILPAVIRDS